MPDVKLGEALSERAERQRRIADLRTRITSNAVTQEDEAPAENARALLDRTLDETAALERLIVAINLTNASARLPNGQLLTEALARRDTLASVQRTLRDAAAAASGVHDLGMWAPARRTRTELKTERHLDATALQDQAEQAAQDLRALDAQVQATNWITDVVEPQE